MSPKSAWENLLPKPAGYSTVGTVCIANLQDQKNNDQRFITGNPLCAKHENTFDATTENISYKLLLLKRYFKSDHDQKCFFA